MKQTRRPLSLAGPVLLLALFAAGDLVAGALALPLPGAAVGFALVLLALRLGAMIAAVREPPRAPARALRRDAGDGGPTLRAANG